jgi:hypothetical protein
VCVYEVLSPHPQDKVEVFVLTTTRKKQFSTGKDWLARDKLWMIHLSTGQGKSIKTDLHLKRDFQALLTKER